MFARPAVLAALFGLVAAASTGCGRAASAPPLPVDLIARVPSARLQPEGAVRTDVVTIGDAATPVLLMPAPSRVTWPVRFPERAELDASLSLTTDTSGVTLRVGLSDDRWYNEILRVRLDPVPAGSPPWQAIRVDLSAFSGWKWSLFYRPSRIAWKLIVNAEATPGGTIAWRQMAIQPHGSQ
jgi:hypothetical protein